MLRTMNTNRDPRIEPRNGDVVWFRPSWRQGWHVALVERVAEGRVYYCRSPINGSRGESVWIDIDGWRQRRAHARLRFPAPQSRGA